MRSRRQECFYAVDIEEYLAVLADRHIKLRDLICLGQVGVKIVLAVRLAELVDRAAGRLAHLGGIVYYLLVEDRQCARHTGADRAGMGVDRCAEARGARAVDLALGGQLRVHFQTDDSFVFHVCLPPLQCRDDVLEAGSLLEGQTCVEQGLLAETRTDELHADRHMILVKAARLNQTRQTGDVDGNRADVACVHLERIGRFGADLVGGGRRDRRQDDVALLECVCKLLADLALSGARLLVVGVVVAGGQHV